MKSLLLTAVVVIAVVFAACSRDDESLPVDPTPTPTATAAESTVSPTPTAAPSETETLDERASFREFAREIDAALGLGDTGFFVDDAVLTTRECGDYHICPTGQTEKSGVSVGLWGGGAEISEIEEFAETMRTRLESGVQLQAIAEAEHHGGVIDGPASFAILTPTDVAATVPVLAFVRDGEQWRLKAFINTGSPSPNEWTSGTCVTCYDYFEPWTE